MNATTALILVVALDRAKDLLAFLVVGWWLVRHVIPGAPARAAPVAPGAVPAALPGPGADAGQPAPAPAPPKPQPRFTNITATSFAGGNDSVSSRTGAYDGKIINGDTELGAALPALVAAGSRLIRVFYNGKSVDVPVRDKGPWNTGDAYWLGDAGPGEARPYAETCYNDKRPLQTGPNKGKIPSNPAGLDLTPAVWAALGYSGDPRDAKAKVAWDFVSVLDGAASVSPAPSASSPSVPVGTGPAHLLLMQKLRDIGVHATNDSPIIMGWPAAIAAKFPDMADYAKSYQHDTTPWCGLTVAYVLSMSGIRPVFGTADTDRFLWAAAWLEFGTKVDTPQPGDVMIFQWAGGGHHVTLYDHEEDDAFYHCTGGNQGSGHEVSTEAMPMKNCVGIRRPPAVA